MPCAFARITPPMGKDNIAVTVLTAFYDRNNMVNTSLRPAADLPMAELADAFVSFPDECRHHGFIDGCITNTGLALGNFRGNFGLIVACVLFQRRRYFFRVIRMP